MCNLKLNAFLSSTVSFFALEPEDCLILIGVLINYTSNSPSVANVEADLAPEALPQKRGGVGGGYLISRVPW